MVIHAFLRQRLCPILAHTSPMTIPLCGEHKILSLPLNSKVRASQPQSRPYF